MEKTWIKLDDRYEVSNIGEIKSVQRNTKFNTCQKEKILKPQLIGQYLAVYIYDRKTKKQKWHYIIVLWLPHLFQTRTTYQK